MPKHEPTACRSPTGFFHFRWTVPVLAALHELRGQAKFVTLQRALGVSRSSLQRTLQALVDSGLVRRNPGYGHPMRPEYLLTEAGRSTSRASAALVARLERLGIEDLALKKWSLPAAYAVERAGGRFNRLRATLGDVTPRALAQALRDLQAAKLVVRQLVDGHPPRSEYQLTTEGRRVTELVLALAEAA